MINMISSIMEGGKMEALIKISVMRSKSRLLNSQEIIRKMATYGKNQVNINKITRFSRGLTQVLIQRGNRLNSLNLNKKNYLM